MDDRIIPVDDATRVSQARRNAVALAQSEGLDQHAVSTIALIATELSTNLVRHAKGGEIHLSGFSDGKERGIQILSIDNGPGIANLRASLQDGYSSKDTQGTGLGAIVRLSHTFDAFSEAGKGSIFLSRVRACSNVSEKARVVTGAVSKPLGSEHISGDSWAAKRVGARTFLLVADGLGHGQFAAEASRKAVILFMETAEEAPDAILQQIHSALKGTRGAAVAIACLDFRQSECRFAGIGNIVGRVIASDVHNMVSHSGTAGHEAQRFQVFTYQLPANSCVVMHTDGLTSSWSLDRSTGLLSHHPAIIAAALYRNACRGRDDACVVAAKWREVE